MSTRKDHRAHAESHFKEPLPKNKDERAADDYAAEGQATLDKTERLRAQRRAKEAGDLDGLGVVLKKRSRRARSIPVSKLNASNDS